VQVTPWFKVPGIDKWITACDGSQQGQWTGRDEPAPVTAQPLFEGAMVPGIGAPVKTGEVTVSESLTR